MKGSDPATRARLEAHAASTPAAPRSGLATVG